MMSNETRNIIFAFGVGVIGVLLATKAKELVSIVSSLPDSESHSRYSNHLGTVDGVMSTVIYGNGTAIENFANHSMDLSSGTGGYSSAAYKMNINVNPYLDNFILNTKIQNIADGRIGIRHTRVGLLLDEVTSNGVYFYQDELNDWYCVTEWTPTITGVNFTKINPLISGDILTIIGLKDKMIFKVNGMVVVEHVGLASSYNFYPYFVVRDNIAAATEARKISCDYIELEVIL